VRLLAQSCRTERSGGCTGLGVSEAFQGKDSMTDESDAPKGRRWRRPPKPNKTESAESASGRAPASVRYGRCEEDLPALHPCIRWVRANVAARREHTVPGNDTPTLSPPASRAAVPTPTAPTGQELNAADMLGGASAASSATDVEEDVMLVGEADDVEYIPVESGSTRASLAAGETAAQQGPAIQPMVESGSTQREPRWARRGSRGRYVVAAVAAAACVVAWLAREPVRLALRGTPPGKQPAAQGSRHARMMRFDVPEMVITLPQEAPAAAKPAVQSAVRHPVAGGKDAAALEELERIAAGLRGK